MCRIDYVQSRFDKYYDYYEINLTNKIFGKAHELLFLQFVIILSRDQQGFDCSNYAIVSLLSLVTICL